MPVRPGVFVVIFAAFAVACQPAPPVSESNPAPTDRQPSNPASAERRTASDGDGPVAYVHGRPIHREDLLEPMIEAAGGEVLAELVLDRLVAEQLEERGRTLTDEDIAAERQRVRASLSTDEDEAARLLDELRRQRGLGERRFEAFLRRNAGLRKLVADQVEIDEDTLRQEHRLRHGERYRVRVLVVERFDEASRLRRQVIEEGAPFSDLAALHSTDASADRGGLLSPISPADPSYPESIRAALPRLAERAEESGREGEARRLSDVIALDGQFALLWFEGKIAAESVEFADVRDRLEAEVRRRLERGYMRQLAREMLSEANVTVLAPALGRSWRQQRGLLLTP